VDVEPRWHETFFAEDWLRIARSIPEEHADLQTDFMVSALELQPGAHMLDIACGHGRHSIRLARRGFRVTGLDSSAESLDAAHEVAEAGGLELDFREGDMRELPFPDGSFDAVINIFTAFGYFEDEEGDACVIGEAARVLRPGGSFLLDTVNPPGLFQRYRDRVWETLDDGAVLFLQEHEYDVLAGRNRARWTLVLPDGTRRELTHSIRVYTAPELDRLLRAAGLEIATAWGDFEGGELTRESWRLILRADKPAQT